MLRFVARKTDRSDLRIAAMMEILLEAADRFEANGKLTLSPERQTLAARAFAGVAAFLQQQILPSVVSEQNTVGERQVRGAIDRAMTTVHALLSHAASIDGRPVCLDLDGSVDDMVDG